MLPLRDGERWAVVCGDALATLRTFPDESVDCCVTSPPYWGLRDYGVDGQYGLETTPWEYLARMVEVFREVRRVLRDDATLWLNIGDCYTGSGRGGYAGDATTLNGSPMTQDESRKARERQRSGSQIIPSELHRRTVENGAIGRAWTPPPDGLKQKDLVGMPWRLAFALQADGWYLRSDIIWAKPNPMPESVTDRPTKAHEYLFLLAKSERYYYEAEAIREAAEYGEPNSPESIQSPHGQGFTRRAKRAGSNNGCDHPRTPDPRKKQDMAGNPTYVGFNDRWDANPRDGRNRRTVWTIATEPFPGAHFAVMPTALVKPCVLAGCRPDGIVLDPFAGSGTVGAVAIEHGCRFLGIDLNPAYVSIARARIDAAAKQGRFEFNSPAKSGGG